MKAVARHITFFMCCLLIFPSAVKLGHFFANHDHVYCDHYSDSHFHQENIDCDLFKFQQVPMVSLDLVSFEPLRPENINTKPVSAYYFLSDYQKLPFALRGPPSLL